MPVTAIASILHRISGLIIFLLIPLLLWWFQLSLESEASFASIVTYLNMPILRFLAWGIMVAIVYHLTAGIKHLLMDMGLFEEKGSSKAFSYVILIFCFIVAVILGAMLWQ